MKEFFERRNEILWNVTVGPFVLWYLRAAFLYIADILKLIPVEVLHELFRKEFELHMLSGLLAIPLLLAFLIIRQTRCRFPNLRLGEGFISVRNRFHRWSPLFSWGELHAFDIREEGLLQRKRLYVWLDEARIFKMWLRPEDVKPISEFICRKLPEGRVGESIKKARGA